MTPGDYTVVKHVTEKIVDRPTREVLDPSWRRDRSVDRGGLVELKRMMESGEL